MVCALTVQMELIIRNTSDQTRVKKNLENYEIRYLPLSDHYQLTLSGGSEVRTFPRLRHVLTDLSTVSLSFSTGVLPAGEYELLARTRLDKRKMPPPMRLPTLFSSKWHHDSDWSAWSTGHQPAGLMSSMTSTADRNNKRLRRLLSRTLPLLAVLAALLVALFLVSGAQQRIPWSGRRTAG